MKIFKLNKNSITSSVQNNNLMIIFIHRKKILEIKYIKFQRLISTNNLPNNTNLNDKIEVKNGKATKNYNNLGFCNSTRRLNKCNASTVNPRISELNIQMISNSLYDQIFRLSECSKKLPTSNDIERSILHLKEHGLWGKEPTISPDVDFNLPFLKGSNIVDHFCIIGNDQISSYINLLQKLISSDIPKMPSTFNFTKGWTKYYEEKSEIVSYPECSSLVFDIEVCLSEGKFPTLACAVSDKYWYSWCSDNLINSYSVQNVKSKLQDLIPLQSDDISSKSSKIIVGHNVSFDRQAIQEQYYLEDYGMRFLDTMSLHIAISGLSEEQRSILQKTRKDKKAIRLPWMNVGCTNSLKEVYKFYCGEELQKEARDLFVKGSISDIRDRFQDLMYYCANDVIATKNILMKLLPLFLDRFPHPVTLSGMLEMGTAYLPVSNSWNQYTSSSEEKFNYFNSKLTSELSDLALKAVILQDGEKYKNDPWLWDLDWSIPKGKVKLLQGYPNWYRKLCMRTKNKGKDSNEKPQNMSTSLKIVPKLLRLTWKGYPLHYTKSEGWGYLKIQENKELHIQNSYISAFPFESLLNMTKKLKDQKWNTEELPGVDIGIPNIYFFPLPHKNGEGYKVGNPLSKDFLGKLEDNTLSSVLSSVAKLVLKTTKTISYWKNNRDRILSQTVIKLDHEKLPIVVKNSENYIKDDEYGAILPQIVTAGTITRRAVEKTWMTASNAQSDRIGSELKSMIRAPPGYNFVGADVDSQELWIASLLGDAFYSRQHGCTALGWMNLQGKKSNGTDMHSKTAQTIGISRNDAKVINYGRIYGAGQKFTQRMLKQFNPSLSDEETKQKSMKLYTATKGDKGWYLNREGVQLTSEIDYKYTGQPLTKKEILHVLHLAKKFDIFLRKEDITKSNPVWVGGSESHMFNCLEAIAQMDHPRTPVLDAQITRALEPWCVGNQFMTSRVNWVVQSSAVDYLHLMLTSMKWLFTEFQINGRFSVSIHDEVRYLVASEDRYRAALALHITNLLTRSFISIRLGLNDLPHSVAFFSSVDVDTVLRKEPDMDCVTPSNPDGLERGYDVPKGERLDIYEVFELTNGNLNKK